MYFKIYQVKLEFYHLTTKMIQTFTDDQVLRSKVSEDKMLTGSRFKGAKSSSGHMSLFLNWYPRQDIHCLINKRQLKDLARNIDGQLDSFYRRALQNSTIQNFII